MAEKTDDATSIGLAMVREHAQRMAKIEPMKDDKEYERQLAMDNDPRWQRYLGACTVLSTLLRYVKRPAGKKLSAELIEAARRYFLYGDARDWKRVMDDFAMTIQSTKGRGAKPKLPDSKILRAEYQRLGGNRNAAGKLALQYNVTPTAVRQALKKK